MSLVVSYRWVVFTYINGRRHVYETEGLVMKSTCCQVERSIAVDGNMCVRKSSDSPYRKETREDVLIKRVTMIQ